MRFSFSPSGTSPRAMRWARPSTMAVLPTPGSPMSTGLFLVRRESTWSVRRISSSRPMTGSSRPLTRGLREIAPVALERLVLALRMRVGDPLTPAHRGQRLEDPRRRDPVRREQPGRRSPVTLEGHRRQQVLGADVVVAQPLRLAFRRLRDRAQARGRAGLRPSMGLGPARQPFAGFLEYPRRLDAEAPQHRRHHPVRLVDQGDEQVLRLDLRVVMPFRELLRGQHRFL